MRHDLIIIGDSSDAWIAAQIAADAGRSVALVRTVPHGVAGHPTPALRFQELQSEWELLVRAQSQLPADHQSAQDRFAFLRSLRHRRIVAAIERDITTIGGRAQFLSRTAIRVENSRIARVLEADRILLAVGTVAPITKLPPALTPEMLPTLTGGFDHVALLGDNRTARALQDLLQPFAKCVRIAEHAILGVRQKETALQLRLATGEELRTDLLIDATGRHAATADLDLEAIGLLPDEQGRVWCDDLGQTDIPTIFAAGESIGYPAALRGGDNVGIVTQALLDSLPAHRTSRAVSPVNARVSQKLGTGGATMQSGAAVIGWRKEMAVACKAWRDEETVRSLGPSLPR